MAVFAQALLYNVLYCTGMKTLLQQGIIRMENQAVLIALNLIARRTRCELDVCLTAAEYKATIRPVKCV